MCVKLCEKIIFYVKISIPKKIWEWKVYWVCILKKCEKNECKSSLFLYCGWARGYAVYFAKMRH